MFKKIYLEIINYCNLNCSFCLKTNHPEKVMAISEFEKIIIQVKEYTNYLYLHIQGEPLLHPFLKEILDICDYYNLKINLTTNATLIEGKLNILNHKVIRQINISLQAITELDSKKKYIDSIIKLSTILDKAIINLRFWAKYNQEDLDYLLNNITYKKLFFSINEEFKWPNIQDPANYKKSLCKAYKNHLGILVNGDVVGCCLDKDSNLCFGNIFNSPLKEILKTSKYLDFVKGFENNKLTEELCQKCTYKKI